MNIRAKGFWDRQQDAFFDVLVFYPGASSYRNSSLASVYRQHEMKKRREYGQRVRDVEHGSFTPLVCTTDGGMAPEATVFFKRLGSILAEQRNETYSATIGWMRTVISFCLLRSSLTCIRWSWSTKSRTINLELISEAVAGGCLPC